MAALVGLSAALSWGSADFMGGLASRRAGALGVLVVSQAIALSLFLLFVAVAGLPAVDPEFVPWAIVAGLSEATALAAFYRGLATGAMGVVAPISAAAGVVPFVVGLASGDPLTATHALGAFLALIGIVMTSLQLGSNDPPAESDVPAVGRPAGAAAGVGLALTAALFFGLFFISVDRAAQGGGVVWAVLVTRTTLVALVVVTFASVGGRLPEGRRMLALLAVIGLFDIGGTTLYAVATINGLLSVVGVLSSSYPLITILLARFVLDERLSSVQRAGSAVTLAGVVLLTL